MSQIEDHPLRYPMANELHARPFPSLSVPCHAVFLAIKAPSDAVGRDRAADRAHLIDLLDRFGTAHPQPEATHFFGDLGRYRLKWEQHAEFMTYTLFADGVAERPFDPAFFDVFPADWLAAAPGVRITSALVRVEQMPEELAEVEERLAECFVPESLAVSHVLDRSAVVAGDYRIDSAGHMRFAVFATPRAGARRVGRIVQRLAEVETYKAMSMLALPRARALSKRLGQIEPLVSDLADDLTGTTRPKRTR